MADEDIKTVKEDVILDDIPTFPVPTEKGFRYYCEGCTGVAFTSDSNKAFSGEKPCQVCGKQLGYREGNFIAL